MLKAGEMDGKRRRRFVGFKIALQKHDDDDDDDDDDNDDDDCFRPCFYTKAILGWGQPGLMR